MKWTAEKFLGGLGSEQIDHQHDYPEGGARREPSLPASPGKEPDGVRRMWNGGPLRQFSDTQAKSHYIAYSGRFLTGYAGSYVCDRCRRPSPGVYLFKETHQWLCGGCKGRIPKGLGVRGHRHASKKATPEDWRSGLLIRRVLCRPSKH
jgi:hypothetical protein